MLRRLLLLISFSLLVGALLFLWSHRFEKVPGISCVDLADLRDRVDELPRGVTWEGNMLSLRREVSDGEPVLMVPLPQLGAVESLRLRVTMDAENLKPGLHGWQEGRLLIQWISVGSGSKEEIDPCAALCGDEELEKSVMVLRPEAGVSIPVLLVEHLGLSGTLTIRKLEMAAVRETKLWLIGRWLLIAAGIAWFWVMLEPSCGPHPAYRKAAAISIWMVMIVQFAVPGPWKSVKPLGIPFHTAPAVKMDRPGERESASLNKEGDPEKREFQASRKSAGEIPLPKGGLIWVKTHLARFRPLLHSLMLFGPSLAFVWLVGKRNAIGLSSGLAIGIELAQTAFGYGFDIVDVADLFCDGIGIAVALLVAIRLPGWWVRLRLLRAGSGLPHFE